MTEETSVGQQRRVLANRVSAILKASREDLDVSQEQLATSLEWTRATIANIETGRRTVGLIDFILIARALHIEPQRLLQRVLQW